jgi:hypothetical protein
VDLFCRFASITDCLMIKKIFLTVLFVVFSLFSFSQCTPNPIYQDSMPNIWPSSGFPNGMVGVSYCQSWDMKTPSTLIDAALGDTAFVTIDTLGNTIYIGDFIVDSLVTIEVYDIPPGLIVECSTPSCNYPGDQVGCVNISGIPTTIGTYTTDILSNLYAHGVISLTIGGQLVTTPVELDYFSVTGAYDTVSRYTITIVGSSSSIDSCAGYYFTAISEKENNLEIINLINKKDHLYLNISSGNTCKYFLTITDILGRNIYSDNLLITSGRNEYNINKHIENGIYIITLNNDTNSFSKKIQVTSPN